MINQSRLKFKGTMKIVSFLIFFLLLFQMTVSHQLAISGKELVDLEVEAKKISKANNLLEEEIAQAGSLAAIEKEAIKLGFKPIDQLLQISSEVPIAYGLGE